MSNTVPSHRLNLRKPYLTLITDRSSGVYPPGKEKLGVLAIQIERVSATGVG
jgi:hypothetical protein